MPERTRRAEEADEAVHTTPQSEPPLAHDAGGEGMPHHLTALARDGTILAMSEDVGGTPASDFLGTSARGWVDGASLATFDQVLEAVFETRRPQTFEWLAAVSGRRYVSRLIPSWDGDQTMQAILFSDDISTLERERAERGEQEQLIEALVDGTFEGLHISVQGTILVANAELARMLRIPLDRLIGRDCFDFCSPEDLEQARALAHAGGDASYEATAVRADGTTFPCEVMARSIAYRGQPARLASIRDITERRRAERDRRALRDRVGQAQKLESLGTLAAGIAHAFNDVLTAVLASAEVALRDSDVDGTPSAQLRTIRASAIRGRELTRQLLDYAAHEPFVRQAVHLNELVRDTAALLATSLGKKAELSLELTPAQVVVLGDPVQLRQLMMNLILNASDALGDRSGHIIVRTLRERASEDLAPDVPASLPRRDDIRVCVTDDGKGMDADTKARIFDPFFSSKGRGRGLGLAAALSVVHGHEGRIEVDSEVGSGTRFTLTFPAHDAQAMAPLDDDDDEDARGAAPLRGLALVADDEAVLRELTCQLLAGMGFETVTAEDGREALHVFERERARLALLVLDLAMPELSGAEVVRILREAGVDLPILCTSGYGATKIGAIFTHDPRTRFLPKPYSAAELEAILRVLLHGLARGARRGTLVARHGARSPLPTGTARRLRWAAATRDSTRAHVLCHRGDERAGRVAPPTPRGPRRCRRHAAAGDRRGHRDARRARPTSARDIVTGRRPNRLRCRHDERAPAWRADRAPRWPDRLERGHDGPGSRGDQRERHHGSTSRRASTRAHRATKLDRGRRRYGHGAAPTGLRSRGRSQGTGTSPGRGGADRRPTSAHGGRVPRTLRQGRRRRTAEGSRRGPRAARRDPRGGRTLSATMDDETALLRAKLELSGDLDALLEDAMRHRTSLARTMRGVMPVIAQAIGAEAAAFRTYGEDLGLMTFTWPDKDAVQDLAPFLEAAEGAEEPLPARAVGQALDVAGEWFGRAALMLPAQASREDHARASELLQTACEELDNHFFAIHVARRKQRAAMALSHALRVPVLAEGMARAVAVLADEVPMSQLLVVLRAEDSPDAPVHLQFYQGTTRVRCTLTEPDPALDAAAKAYLTTGDGALPSLLGLGEGREEVLIHGTSAAPVGKLLVLSRHGDFDTNDRDLLASFASYICQRVVDFNKEHRTLSRSFSHEVVARMLRHADYERRYLAPREEEVAMLYVDISGFTRVSEQILRDPEAIGHLVDVWGRRAVDLVWRHGGAFDKMVGDCVIGLFGPPFYELDTAGKVAAALRAALEIREMTEALPDDPGFSRLREGGLSVSTGVHIGRLFVGRFGPNDNFTGFSAAMNNTARLQGQATRGQILVMEDAVTAVSPSRDFSFGPPEEAKVKNVAAPLRFRELRSR